MASHTEPALTDTAHCIDIPPAYTSGASTNSNDAPKDAIELSEILRDTQTDRPNPSETQTVLQPVSQEDDNTPTISPKHANEMEMRKGLTSTYCGALFWFYTAVTLYAATISIWSYMYQHYHGCENGTSNSSAMRFSSEYVPLLVVGSLISNWSLTLFTIGMGVNFEGLDVRSFWTLLVGSVAILPMPLLLL